MQSARSVGAECQQFTVLFDQYCISHKTIGHRAAAAGTGPEVRRECCMSKCTALPLLATNPGDAAGSI